MRIGINLSPFVQLQRGGASRTASGGFFAPVSENDLLIGRSRSQPSRLQLQPRVVSTPAASAQSGHDSAVISRHGALYADAQRALDRLRQQALGPDVAADRESVEAAVAEALAALNT